MFNGLVFLAAFISAALDEPAFTIIFCTILMIQGIGELIKAIEDKP